MRILTATLALMAMFWCTSYIDSWRDKGQNARATLPIREMVPGTSYSVSVRVLDGDWQPMCMLPDAANDIGCTFHYGWLEHGMLMNQDAYLFMSGPDARQACSDALWSVGPEFSDAWVIDACARALMAHRWMVDNEYGVNREDQ